jgi:hypothetical protein
VFESNASAQQQPATPRVPQQPRARATQPQPVQPPPSDDDQ